MFTECLGWKALSDRPGTQGTPLKLRKESGDCLCIVAMFCTPIFHTIKFWVRVLRGLCMVPLTDVSEWGYWTQEPNHQGSEEGLSGTSS